ncbi:ATP-binding protein [Streptomyces coryli]|uniref:ATP-binding protein n=1 Tax=Streptomyces coryli TaxID=1128680 RepID=UPI001F118A1B|nr:ATP-binding protein [Streptomyces coryli]
MTRSPTASATAYWLWAVATAAVSAAAVATVLGLRSGTAAACVAAATVPVAALSLAWALREREEVRRQRAIATARAAELERAAAVADERDQAARRERNLRDSVQAAFETVAGNVHAMATVQGRVLDGIEQRVSDPEVLSEVMRADHAAAQMTRKAQTLMVLCGVWPARRATKPISLYDCVRGAQSRIVEYGRVEVHGGQGVHVAAGAAEGLMHTLAELLENATDFSPATSPVLVSVREVASGAVVEVDDAGLGMPPDALEEAGARLRDGLEITDLGAVPRLGLACVGRWSRELGFTVELSTASGYGGTRAVLFVPHRLLTMPPAEPEPPARRRTRGGARDRHRGYGPVVPGRGP